MKKTMMEGPAMSEMKPRLSLEGDYIPAGDHKVGEEMDMSMRCKVVGMSEREYDGKKTKCLDLEIMKPMKDDKAQMKEKMARKMQKGRM